MKKALHYLIIVLLFLSVFISFSAELPYLRTMGQYPICLPKTGQSKIYHSRDDGALQKGVSWPKPRFIIQTNGTITDNLTGLMWERFPSPKRMNWHDAFKRIKELNTIKLGGFGDWRLPNINELASLINYNVVRYYQWLTEQRFVIVSKINAYYWSSTTNIRDIQFANCIMWDGFHLIEKKEAFFNLGGDAKGDYYTLATRTEKAGIIKLPRTGQIKSYHSGDDGDLLLGIPYPHTRFVKNGNGTITDKLTGLMWEISPSQYTYNWFQAFGRIVELNATKLGGYNDWRLPNIIELRSLANMNNILSEFLNQSGFNNIERSSYWSSTSRDFQSAWYMSTTDGAIRSGEKLTYPKGLYVIAVRGGN